MTILLDEQCTLIASWGKLCHICGGSGSLFVPTPEKFISYNKCPGDPVNGLYCRAGIIETLKQNPTSAYYEEIGTGYNPRWKQAGYTRRDYLAAKEHWKAMPKYVVPQFMPPISKEVVNPRKEPIIMKKTLLDKINLAVIDAIEWPFKQVKKQWHRWFNVNNGSIRQEIEQLIGTEVTYTVNHAQYTTNRHVKNKWVELWRKHRFIKIGGGQHVSDKSKWWTIDIRNPKRFAIDLTWRENVGWTLNYWKLGEKGFCVRKIPLIWRIKENKMQHWPAPVFETMH